EVITVVAIDASDNQSPAITVTASDITAPDVPSAVMNEQGFRVTGFAEAGSTVIIRNAADQILGNVVAHAVTGAYSITLNNAFTNGEHFQLVAIDRHGNVSDAALVIASDTTAPLVPVAAISSDGARITGT